MEIDRSIGLDFCLWLFEKLRYLILSIECRVLDRRRPADRLACVYAHLCNILAQQKPCTNRLLESPPGYVVFFEVVNVFSRSNNTRGGGAASHKSLCVKGEEDWKGISEFLSNFSARKTSPAIPRKEELPGSF